jgi:hypothetical protein
MKKKKVNNTQGHDKQGHERGIESMNSFASLATESKDS